MMLGVHDLSTGQFLIQWLFFLFLTVTLKQRDSKSLGVRVQYMASGNILFGTEVYGL